MAAQTDAPVTHEVAPVLHGGVVGVQLVPDVQAVQVPLSQTLFAAQVERLARFRPVSEQVIAGEQTAIPAWQALAGVHASPAVHATQAPALQTLFIPHVVPFATFPATRQTATPVLQVVIAVWQGLPVTVQLAPTVQLPQTPAALQTLFIPHVVPAATSVPLSVHCGIPVAQASAP